MSNMFTSEQAIERLPVVVLMLKTDCNCRCAMCDIWKDTSKASLPLQTIENISRQMKSLRTREIVLSGGEPLMHKEIEKICRLLYSKNFKITLITTGLLLKHHASWISECIKQIYVSLDGPEDVHNSIRNIPGAFGKITRGIETVRNFRKNIGIGGRCTVHKQNFQHIVSTVAAAKEAGMDSISFLAADIQQDNFGRTSDWNENGISLSAEEIAELDDILEQLYINNKVDFESGFIVESRDKLQKKLLDYYRALAEGKEFPEVDCNAPWVSSVIETDGRIRPCFFHKPYDENINDGTITDILNSSSAKDWRKNLDVKTDAICKSCVCSLSYRE